MRAILFVLILAVAALIVALATGYLDVDQTQPARAPDIDAGGGGVTARGGQPPTFEIETGSVSVGTTQRNVTLPVPTVEVTPPNEQQASNDDDGAVRAAE